MVIPPAASEWSMIIKIRAVRLAIVIAAASGQSVSASDCSSIVPSGRRGCPAPSGRNFAVQFRAVRLCGGVSARDDYMV